MNQPSQEVFTTVETGKVRQRVQNAKNLPIEEYFSQRKFECVYDRLEGTREDLRSFTGRLKGVDYLMDYNWRSYKELEPEIAIHSARSE